jgi:hypothetical protein
MTCNETSRFRQTCDHTIRNLSAMLETTSKAMHIRYVGKSAWGIGHMMPAVYKAHASCIKYRRRCFLTMYGSRMERFFGYENGMTWDVKDMPQYRNTSHIRVVSLDEIPSVLDDELVVVTVTRHIPFSSETWLATLPWDTGTMTLTKCMCRFVTAPRIPMTTPVNVSTVYHLRTGYADTRLKKHVCNSSLARSIIDMACPETKFENVTVVTDTPVLRRMVRRRDTSVVSAQLGFAMDRHLYADIMSCSAASIIYTQRQSSFVRPILARSFCGPIVRAIDRSPLCPHFTDVFPRDIFLATRHEIRFLKMRTKMPVWHPCRYLSGYACEKKLDDALS